MLTAAAFTTVRAIQARGENPFYPILAFNLGGVVVAASRLITNFVTTPAATGIEEEGENKGWMSVIYSVLLGGSGSGTGMGMGTGMGTGMEGGGNGGMVWVLAAAVCMQVRFFHVLLKGFYYYIV